MSTPNNKENGMETTMAEPEKLYPLDIEDYDEYPNHDIYRVAERLDLVTAYLGITYTKREIVAREAAQTRKINKEIKSWALEEGRDPEDIKTKLEYLQSKVRLQLDNTATHYYLADNIPKSGKDE